MAFEWDAAKNSANIAKHGIDFDDAIRLFEGPVLESIDGRRDYGEARIIAFGVVDRLRTGRRLHDAWQASQDYISKES
jgi:uncharacterized DUF497 family protein